MLGHWLSSNNKDVDMGWQHFQVATKTGRVLEYVRSMQFSALKNIDYSNIDFLKLLQEMRSNGEYIKKDVASHVLKTNYLGNGFGRFVDALRTGDPVVSSITPKDDLVLFEWIYENPDVITKYQLQRTYVRAILTEAAGDNITAAKMYTELYAGLPDDNPTAYKIDGYLQNAITRTGSSQ